MAYSTQSAVSDGTLAVLPLSIDYLSRDDITVYLGSAQAVKDVAWSWVGTIDRSIKFTPAVPKDVVVTVKRSTGVTGLYHKFSGGAQFTSKTLDESLTQTLFVAQEFSESSSVASDDLPLPVGSQASAGKSNKYARTDHVHVGMTGGAVGSVVMDTFVGDGVKLSFALTNTPVTKGSTQVYIDSVYQSKAVYSLVGPTITFDEAPVVSANIEVVTVTIGGGKASDIQLNETPEMLATDTGGNVQGGMVWLAKSLRFVQDGTGAVIRTLRDKLRDKLDVRDFGAKGDGTTDDTAAVQAAFTAAALLGKVPRFSAGSYKLTTTVDAKGVSLYGDDRQLSKIVAAVPNGTPVFKNIGQTARDLTIEGPGGTAKPDGIAFDGYRRFITNITFHQLGAALCPSAIIVTTVVSQNEFWSCESAINDKLLDGTNAHTTLYFTHNDVLYCSKAFDMRTDAAGFWVQGNVFEDLYAVYEGNGKQIFGSLFSSNWVEQMSRSVTLLSNTYAGGTNQFQMNQVRPGSFAVLDGLKWGAGQYTLSGDASGGGGGVASDDKQVRVTDFTGNGVLITSAGIRPAAAKANFSNAVDLRIEGQNANSNQASKGGDIIIAPGAGSLGQRAGALRADLNDTTDLGQQSVRWRYGWLSYLKVGGNVGFTAPTQAFSEFNNNTLNGISLATYNANTGPFAVCNQSEFAGPSGAVAGAGYLYLGKNNGAITFQVQASGNVQNVSNSYGAISDAKLKDNVVDASPKLDALMRVRIVNYALKSEPGSKYIGVIAQELEQVFPGMVEETPDFEAVLRTRTVPAVLDDAGAEIEPERVEEYTELVDAGTVTKSVKYSVFVPMLVKALQEATARIAALEARK